MFCFLAAGEVGAASKTAQTAPKGAMVKETPLEATIWSILARRAIARKAPTEGHKTSLKVGADVVNAPPPLALALRGDADCGDSGCFVEGDGACHQSPHRRLAPLLLATMTPRRLVLLLLQLKLLVGEDIS